MDWGSLKDVGKEYHETTCICISKEYLYKPLLQAPW